MDLQAQDRAHRIGQKKEVRVYRLVTNTRIEETILTKAAHKRNVEAKVIEAGLFNAKSTEYERRERLRNLLKNDEDDEDSVKDENLISSLMKSLRGTLKNLKFLKKLMLTGLLEKTTRIDC